MKNLMIILFVLMVASCGDEVTKSTDPNVPVNCLGVKFDVPGNVLMGESPVYTVLIDSCEYLYISYSNASWGAHKGNCKYCAARRVKELDSLLDVKFSALKK